MESNSQKIQHQTKIVNEQNVDLNIKTAISDLNNVIEHLSVAFDRLRRIRYEQLIQTYEMLCRLDFPTIMLDTIRREIQQLIPSLSGLEAA